MIQNIVVLIRMITTHDQVIFLHTCYVIFRRIEIYLYPIIKICIYSSRKSLISLADQNQRWKEAIFVGNQAFSQFLPKYLTQPINQVHKLASPGKNYFIFRLPCNLFDRSKENCLDFHHIKILTHFAPMSVATLERPSAVNFSAVGIPC